MRIGIMLRHYDQHGGGVWLYTRSLLKELFALNTAHEFVLLYRNPKSVGTHARADGSVREVGIRAPSVLLWDQLAVTWAERREKLDLIFNPKYSLPLMARCPGVFVCHGLDWYVMPWGSRWIDRLSHRHLIPRYARKAEAIISVSDTTRKHVIEYLGVQKERVRTIHMGVDETLAAPLTLGQFQRIQRKYNLPDRFFLYVGQIYPPKNFGRLLRAYAEVGPGMGIHLVVAGEHRWLCEDEIALIDRLGLSRWVVQTGWIGHAELAAFYRMAEALVMPSLYESFLLPLLEAMLCDCPVVTSNRYGTQEVAGEAAVLVDPDDVTSIADGMRRVATDQDLRETLKAAGRERVACFSWKKCARATLGLLEAVGAQAPKRVEARQTEATGCV